MSFNDLSFPLKLRCLRVECTHKAVKDRRNGHEVSVAVPGGVRCLIDVSSEEEQEGGDSSAGAHGMNYARY